MSTIVDELNKEFDELTKFLVERGEFSLKSTADNVFRKALLLAAASHFERQLCDYLIEFVGESDGSNELIKEFVKNKAIARQYHTLFEWDRANANRFFSLFGEKFKTFMVDRVNADEALDRSIRAFLELGRDRNRLVHQDFGTFSLEKNSSEIYELYKEGAKFISGLSESFLAYRQQSDRTNQ